MALSYAYFVRPILTEPPSAHTVWYLSTSFFAVLDFFQFFTVPPFDRAAADIAYGGIRTSASNDEPVRTGADSFGTDAVSAEIYQRALMPAASGAGGASATAVGGHGGGAAAPVDKHGPASGDASGAPGAGVGGIMWQVPVGGGAVGVSGERGGVDRGCLSVEAVMEALQLQLPDDILAGGNGGGGGAAEAADAVGGTAAATAAVTQVASDSSPAAAGIELRGNAAEITPGALGVAAGGVTVMTLRGLLVSGPEAPPQAVALERGVAQAEVQPPRRRAPQRGLSAVSVNRAAEAASIAAQTTSVAAPPSPLLPTTTTQAALAEAATVAADPSDLPAQCLTVAVNPRVLLVQPVPAPGGPPDRAGDDAGGGSAAADVVLPTLHVTVQRLAAPPDGRSVPIPSQLEVLVRTGGLYLPSRVRWLPVRPGTVRAAAGSGFGAGSSGGGLAEDEGEGNAAAAGDGRDLLDQDADRTRAAVAVVELLEAPPHPGVLMLDLRWRGQPYRAVPLLVAADSRVATELQAAADTWPRSPLELSELLFDFGVWELHNYSLAQGTPAAAPPAGLTAEAAPDGAQGPPLHGFRCPPPLLPALGQHLLHYSLACGWGCAVDRLRRDLVSLAEARRRGSGVGWRCPRSPP
ncbi:hypothetical protein GPECTOR_4g689 [Gonium pectorale]|uniref:Uncharacterized protein n=1 Tax=Gonium pectorale TaxID=33097 RepID=A0A150GXV9_GONPE|nr:hypothetical protein GPECTOR_4g689 [Gonium pectorale]|eukprot:KXZ54624.1 hypothetical protein GPECTOR_4g689 [Gonium pectorale]